MYYTCTKCGHRAKQTDFKGGFCLKCGDDVILQEVGEVNKE